MCNLSKGIIERSEKKGTMKNQIQNLHSLMSNLNISLAKAMELLNIPKEDQEAIIAAMSQ